MVDPQPALAPPGTRSLVGAAEILRALVTKELKVKYKRSVLGFMWSLVTPAALTAVYLFVFVYVYKVAKPDFILFLLSGLLPWHFFNITTVAATGAFVDNAPLIRKVFFPRFLVPLASVAANLLNLLLALGLLLVFLLAMGRPVWLHLHWVLLGLTLETGLLIGVCLILSIGNVYFRDIGQLISILIMVLFFATPVVYGSDQVPTAFRVLMLLNPLAGVMESFRAGLFTFSAPDLMLVGISGAEVVLLLFVGIWIYRRFGPTLAKEL